MASRLLVMRQIFSIIITVCVIAAFPLKLTAELADLSSVPVDLVVPQMVKAAPAAGKRVQQTTQGWEGTQVHHALYLPVDWKPGAKFQVIVEYAGNGGYHNRFGDVCEGTVQGSKMGYGLSAGRGFIWVCMPFVEEKNSIKVNALRGAGDIAETKRYCVATVRAVCRDWGGDEKAVILSGFSRGGVACNKIGLHDDEIAKLWRGFICASSYECFRSMWDQDKAEKLARLKRLGGRPQFICMEERAGLVSMIIAMVKRSAADVAAVRDYLKQTGIDGDFTFVPIHFRNHDDAWTLRDIPERRQAREWLQKVIASDAGQVRKEQ